MCDLLNILILSSFTYFLPDAPRVTLCGKRPGFPGRLPA